MLGIPVYAEDTDNFANNGLGLIMPTACEVEGEGDTLWEATIEMPIEQDGRFSLLQIERCVKLVVPVPPAPEAEEAGEDEEEPAETQDAPVLLAAATQTVQIYRLKKGVSVNLRQKPSASAKIIDAYSNQAEVILLSKYSSYWWKVQMKKGGAVGYMAQQYLVFVREESSGGGGSGGGESPFVVPTASRKQLFRIYSVETDTEQGMVTARALHISYDLRGYIVNREYKPEKVAAKKALQACWNALSSESPFTLYIGDITGKVTGDYSYRPFSDVLLNDSDGILVQCGARIVRDNFDLYVMPAEPVDRGVTIRRGKNLDGVSVTIDTSEVVTHIMPCGKKANGDPLFLPETYIISPNAGLYAYPRVKKIDYDVQVDSEGEYPSTSAAYTALRNMAAAEYTDEYVDQPIYGMDIDFVGIENTPEFAGTDYANLQAVFLHDLVAIIDELIGLIATIQVTAYRWDVLNESYLRLTVGTLPDLG